MTVAEPSSRYVIRYSIAPSPSRSPWYPKVTVERVSFSLPSTSLYVFSSQLFTSKLLVA
jgi:hypothetical protein